MKKSTYIVILVLSLGMAFSACKKEEAKPVEIDYRDFFVGTYQGVRTSTMSEYVDTPSSSVEVDSNIVFTITKKGDYPSTEIIGNGGVYNLVVDDRSHTTAVNINGSTITVGNYKIRTYSSYWANSYENYTTVYQGSKMQ